MLLRLHTVLILLALCPGSLYASDDTQARALVRAAAEESLSRRFPEHAHRLEVRVMRLGGEVSGTAPVRLRFPSEQSLPRAHTQVKVLSGTQQAGWQETGWALLYVAHFDSVAVARTSIRSDEVVTPADVAFAWMETTRFRGTPLRPEAFRALTASGEVFTARPLREGRALHEDDLRPPYAADTGELVVMRYLRGAIKLHITCKAREPGFAGEIIRLYSPDTQTTYRARLTGSGTAEWTETL